LENISAFAHSSLQLAGLLQLFFQTLIRITVMFFGKQV
jgi:hypothetical protein